MSSRWQTLQVRQTRQAGAMVSIVGPAQDRRHCTCNTTPAAAKTRPTGLAVRSELQKQRQGNAHESWCFRTLLRSTAQTWSHSPSNTGRSMNTNRAVSVPTWRLRAAARSVSVSATVTDGASSAGNPPSSEALATRTPQSTSGGRNASLNMGDAASSCRSRAGRMPSAASSSRRPQLWEPTFT
jgi:hypothetical protein